MNGVLALAIASVASPAPIPQPSRTISTTLFVGHQRSGKETAKIAPCGTALLQCHLAAQALDQALHDVQAEPGALGLRVSSLPPR